MQHTCDDLVRANIHPKYLGFGLWPLSDRRGLSIPFPSNGSLSPRSRFRNNSRSLAISSYIASSTGRCFHYTKLSVTSCVPCLSQRQSKTVYGSKIITPSAVTSGNLTCFGSTIPSFVWYRLRSET